MATYRDIIKPWFETGDKPTQQQFWTLFDYLFFKDEAVVVENIAGLSALLSGKANQLALDTFIGGELQLFNADGTYDIPAGFLLEKMIVIPTDIISLKIGYANDADDIGMEDAVTTDGVVYVVNIFAKAVKRIYFTGIAAGTQIVFFKRKVNLG